MAARQASKQANHVLQSLALVLPVPGAGCYLRCTLGASPLLLWLWSHAAAGWAGQHHGPSQLCCNQAQAARRKGEGGVLHLGVVCEERWCAERTRVWVGPVFVWHVCVCVCALGGWHAWVRHWSHLWECAGDCVWWVCDPQGTTSSGHIYVGEQHIPLAHTPWPRPGCGSPAHIHTPACHPAQPLCPHRGCVPTQGHAASRAGDSSMHYMLASCASWSEGGGRGRRPLHRAHLWMAAQGHDCAPLDRSGVGATAGGLGPQELGCCLRESLLLQKAGGCWSSMLRGGWQHAPGKLSLLVCLHPCTQHVNVQQHRSLYLPT
jgi:hypothetical protein